LTTRNGLLEFGRVQHIIQRLQISSEDLGHLAIMG
jgi:hypothetical protein